AEVADAARISGTGAVRPAARRPAAGQIESPSRVAGRARTLARLAAPSTGPGTAAQGSSLSGLAAGSHGGVPDTCARPAARPRPARAGAPSAAWGARPGGAARAPRAGRGPRPPPPSGTQAPPPPPPEPPASPAWPAGPGSGCPDPNPAPVSWPAWNCWNDPLV